MQNLVVVCIILHKTKLGRVVHLVADQIPLHVDRLRDLRQRGHVTARCGQHDFLAGVCCSSLQSCGVLECVLVQPMLIRVSMPCALRINPCVIGGLSVSMPLLLLCRCNVWCVCS